MEMIINCYKHEISKLRIRCAVPPMLKHDITKKINDNIDKIIDNYIESLMIFKKERNDIKDLFFAKRRIVKIILITLEIYESTIDLNNIYKMEKRKKSCLEYEKLFKTFLEQTEHVKF